MCGVVGPAYPGLAVGDWVRHVGPNQQDGVCWLRAGPHFCSIVDSGRLTVALESLLHNCACRMHILDENRYNTVMHVGCISLDECARPA
jgi:hypothetical protein